MARKEREFEASERMSEHEALMWNVEKDPWLNSSGASLTLLDKPADFTKLRRIMAAAVVQMPRLVERVVPAFGRLSTPAWTADAEFDLDYHLQEIELAGDGSQRDVFDLATRLYNEPLDRTRPLWRFVSIRGLQNGGGAIYVMMHHVIADGIGQMRMAELYQQLSADEPAPAEVDLKAHIAKAVEASNVKESGGADGDALADAVRDSVAHLARRNLGIARRIAGEVVLWPADPGRMNDTLVKLGEGAAAAMNQLSPSPDGDSHGSGLWQGRSRHRRLEHVTVNVDDLKAAGQAVGASLNDAFLAGLAEAAHRYHMEREVPAQTFNSSFVLSTRTDTKAGGNSFTPVPVRLPGGPMSIRDRLQLVHETTRAAREQAERTGGLGGLSGLANLLPTSVVTRAGRAQGARIDFATSNLRSAPIQLYCAGAKVLRTIVLGPVAATGANITAMSYMGKFEIGMFIDPAAITEPEAFRDYVESAFEDMFAELTPSPKKTAAKKTAPKKAASKKSAPKKIAAKKVAPRKAAAKKSAAKRTTKKVAAKKTAAKRTTKKAAPKKTAAKRTTKKAAPKKAAPKKTAAKRTGRAAATGQATSKS